MTEKISFFAGVALALIVFGAPIYLVGKRAERQEIRAEEARKALDRISQMETDNANFRKLSDRDRCLVFMRDSGLPDSACD